MLLIFNVVVVLCAGSFTICSDLITQLTKLNQIVYICIHTLILIPLTLPLPCFYYFYRVSGVQYFKERSGPRGIRVPSG